MIPSSGGVFEISLGGQPLFSKKALGRFPEDGEIERALADLVAGSS
jgi:selenoprotein W-related protein